MTKRLKALLDNITPQRAVYIQCHDFPDHDAVGSAFGLFFLLRSYGVETTICYRGEMQSLSLQQAIQQLHIPVYSLHELPKSQAQIIAVDGIPYSLDPAIGSVVAVVDHHNLSLPETCVFKDVRISYGACSTIVWEYFVEEGVEPSRDVATALLLGIMMDTMLMTRGVSQGDLNAFSRLFFIADWELSSRLLRNSLSLTNLPIFSEAINNHHIHGNFAFIAIKQPCTTEVQALVADFFLSLREVTVVAVVISQPGGYRVSIRSEDKSIPGDYLVSQVLQDIGEGGGHAHMSGGYIEKKCFPGIRELEERFKKAIS